MVTAAELKPASISGGGFRRFFAVIMHAAKSKPRKIFSAPEIHTSRNNAKQSGRLTKLHGRFQRLGYRESLSVADILRVQELNVNVRQREREDTHKGRG